MGLKLDADTHKKLTRVVRGVRNDSGPTVAIEEIPVPRQHDNECAASALGDVFELAPRKSNGFEGLDSDLECIQAKSINHTAPLATWQDTLCTLQCVLKVGKRW